MDGIYYITNNKNNKYIHGNEISISELFILQT